MASKINELVSMITGPKKKKTSSYDSSAVVTRVDGDVVYVHIPGGVPETPVKRTINAKVGDTVQIRTADHKSWIVGNMSAPPTDDRTAEEAKATATKAVYTAETALEDAVVAHEAAESATASAATAGRAASVAQAAAEAAQETANTKKTVFVTQPVPPYHVGDLWARMDADIRDLVDQNGDNLVDDQNALFQAAILQDASAYVCLTPKLEGQEFSEDDWSLATADKNLREWFWHDALGAHILGDVTGYRNDLNSTGMHIVDTRNEVALAEFEARGISFNHSVPFVIGNQSGGSYIRWHNAGTEQSPRWQIDIAADHITMGGDPVGNGESYKYYGNRSWTDVQIAQYAYVGYQGSWDQTIANGVTVNDGDTIQINVTKLEHNNQIWVLLAKATSSTTSSQAAQATVVSFTQQTGDQGPQGIQGTPGTPGSPGSPGTSYYVFVRYSPNSDGSNMTTSPQTDSQYIGVYSGTSSSAPSSASSYTWSKYVGPQGSPGTPGSPGSPGTSYYVFVRYSPNSDGSNMTTTPQATSAYIGIYSGTSSTAPSSASSYTWSKYVGPEGPSSTYMDFYGSSYAAANQGLFVHSDAKGTLPSAGSGTQINSNGVVIRKAGTDVAFFGQSSRIGELSSKNLVIDSNGIQGYNNTTKEIGISLSNGFEIKKETNDCKSRLYTNVVSGSATYILEASGGTNKNVGCEANATSSGSNAISLYATKGTNEAFIQMRADTAGEIYVNNGKYYGLLDDFVIKQGTSSNWRYRKWSSGFIEAWYESTATASATTAVSISSRTVSYRSTWSTTIPSAIGFTSTPKIIVSLGSSSDIRMSINGAASSTTAISGYCWRSSSSSSTYDITPRIYAWGV